MRPILLLALVAMLASTPASAQSAFELGGVGRQPGPNARAAQRPLGPNAQAAQRRAGPGSTTASTERQSDGQVYYPSCAAARAERATPVRRGEPGYGRHLDSDGNGLACDPGDRGN